MAISIRTPERTIDRIAPENHVELLAVSVMPGPQMVAAIPVCREFRAKLPIGADRVGRILSFALYRRHSERAIRRLRGQGQGEETLPELLAALRGNASSPAFGVFRTKTFSDCTCIMRIGRCARRTTFPLLPYHRLQTVGTVSAADVSRTPHGRSSGQHRLSVPLPVLRRGADL